MAKPRISWDPFLIAILAAAALGFFFPASGSLATALSWLTKAAIFALFAAYGARLSITEAWAGLRHWRLHSAILGFTYLAFPMLALGILALPQLFDGSQLGLAYLCLVPSTVQSSVTFTSIARGNVPGAIVAATLSNLVGVLVTPALVMLLLSAGSETHVGPESLLAVALQLLLPFALGQLSRPLTASWVSRHRSQLRYLDQSVIALVVFGAFSTLRLSGSWRELAPLELMVLVLACGLILAIMLGLTWWLPKLAGFNLADRITILFCGTKKSLATGAPIAAVLFSPALVGPIVLPLLVFHTMQLLACAAIARRLAQQPQPQTG